MDPNEALTRRSPSDLVELERQVVLLRRECERMIHELARRYEHLIHWPREFAHRMLSVERRAAHFVRQHPIAAVAGVAIATALIVRIFRR